MVPVVVAPPVSGSSSSGFITSITSEIQIVEASINMSITPELLDTGCYIHSIQLQGWFNVTNPLSVNENISFLYRPSWELSLAYYNGSSFETSVEGPPISFSTQTLSNITHPRELPSNLQNRFPDWYFEHDQIWFIDIPFTLMNLSLGPYQSVIFHFNDLINVTSIGINYFEIGFGLSADQIESDSTLIQMQITVVEGGQFLYVFPHPDDHLVDTHEDVDYLYVWNASPPFSSRLVNGITPDPIGAGFNVRTGMVEYTLPGWDTTSTTTSSVTTTSSLDQNILTDLLVVSALWSLFIVVIVFFWKKESSK